MTPHDSVIAAVAEANPVDSSAPPTPREWAQADETRRRVLSSPERSGPRRATVVPALSTIVVIAVIALFLGVGGARHRHTPASPGADQTLILQALPTVQTPVVTPAAMARELQVVRDRLSSMPGTVRATRAGSDAIRLVVSGAVSPAEKERIVRLLTDVAQLYLYDWEANVLTPDGRTVASQLRSQNVAALQISQGAGTGPGYPGSGSMSLYDAVKLAAKQPTAPFSQQLSRLGTQYYLFGHPGSAACAAAAGGSHTKVVAGRYCLLSGPSDETVRTTRARAIADLDAGLPAGVTPEQAAAQGRVLVVPQGTAVIQAAYPSASQAIGFASPAAQFYVLKDKVALSGNDITNPTAGKDQSGSPDVQFAFTGAGTARFRSVTARIARRGAEVSSVGQTENQHFAVVVGGIDSRLITVASIDFRQYPDGLTLSGTSGGADVTGGMTAASAQDLATQLRSGALPLNLRVIR